MKVDELLQSDKYDLLCEIANMYYNQGMTKQEIAAAYKITRFKVAKLLQEARTDHIVDIKIRYKSMRNKEMEIALMRRYPLKRAVVVNTQFSPYLDGLEQLGQVGATYLNKVLTPNSVLGLTWGKTIQSVISQLPQIANNPVDTVALTGRLTLNNASLETSALMRVVANNYFGASFFMDAPLYVSQSKLKDQLFAEPNIVETLKQAQKMSIVLTGIGAATSLSFCKSQFASYITSADQKNMASYIGSIFGYILDKDGVIANIPLNKKVIAVPLETILTTPRRIGVVYGKHKTLVTAKVLRNEYINELITDADTARTLLE